jgi:adenine-specific DNA-methyltransferase
MMSRPTRRFWSTGPTPVDYEADTTAEVGAGGAEDHGSFVGRMLEVLRKSPLLQVGGGKKVTVKNVRPPAMTLSLSAEAMVTNGVIGTSPSCSVRENGPVSEKLVHDAAFEAHGKGYARLYVIGLAIQPNARNLIDNCEPVMSIAATYVQAISELMMGDLLKTMRSSQIFSVCGLPEVKLCKIKAKGNGATQFEVELAGLDVFDPIEMHAHHEFGDNVPAAWLSIRITTGSAFMCRRRSFRARARGTTSRRRFAVPTTKRCGTIWRPQRARHSKPASTARSR